MSGGCSSCLLRIASLNSMYDFKMMCHGHKLAKIRSGHIIHICSAGMLSLKYGKIFQDSLWIFSWLNSWLNPLGCTGTCMSYYIRCKQLRCVCANFGLWLYCMQLYIDFFKNIIHTNGVALITAVLCMVAMYTVKRWVNPKVQKRLKMPVPSELIVVCIQFCHFSRYYKRFVLEAVYWLLSQCSMVMLTLL